jgi:hypothetical protein
MKKDLIGLKVTLLKTKKNSDVNDPAASFDGLNSKFFIALK